jgi:transmembrane sensor
MDNIYEFTDRAVIEQEAGEWLIKIERETPLTEHEKEALKVWINRSPAHRAEINQLAEFWSDMNVLTELAVPLGKSESQIERDQIEAKRVWVWRGGVATMAASVLCIAVALTLLFVQPPGQHENNTFYATVVGQQKTATLQDGSVIQLNTNSQLEVKFSSHYRDIYLLQGEAHFTVAKNPDRPFRVYAGNGKVQAIGTAFSVYLNGQNIDVTVTEGRVGLAAINQNPSTKDDSSTSPIEKNLGQLNAGQRAIMNNTRVNRVMAESDVDPVLPVVMIEEREQGRRLAWREGILKFTGDPLEKVVEEISRYTSLTIEIVDPNMRSIRIGGQFRIGETDVMLESLENNFGINVQRIGSNRVLLSKAVE